MGKISYYLVVIVVAGGAVALLWTYQRYFKVAEPKLLQFAVERGNIHEVVKVRGEVVAEKEFDLAFPFSGTVEKVFVREGQIVTQGEPLMRLETIDLKLEIQKLNAAQREREAALNKLITGVTPEDIAPYKISVDNAKTAYNDAKNGLLDKQNDAYTKADDAIRNYADQLFNDGRRATPSLMIAAITGQPKIDLELQRANIEPLFAPWKNLLGASSIKTTKDNLGTIKGFLDNLAFEVNGLTSSGTLAQSTINTYKTTVSTARTNVDGAISGISVSEEKLNLAESNLALATRELAAKEAKARVEDVEAARAQIDGIKSQIAAVAEKIRKSTLVALVGAKITKVWFEVGEVFQPGKTAVALSTTGHKIQADISELEIGKIREGDGNIVAIFLDAFPKNQITGKVVSVEPQEVIKEGDKYYRVNIYLEPHGLEVRAGMNADVTIAISTKEEVLKIPEFTIDKQDDKKFVKILDGNTQREVEIVTGISDGESIEIMSGLQEGQIVIVSAS